MSTSAPESMACDTCTRHRWQQWTAQHTPAAISSPLPQSTCQQDKPVTVLQWAATVMVLNEWALWIPNIHFSQLRLQPFWTWTVARGFQLEGILTFPVPFCFVSFWLLTCQATSYVLLYSVTVTLLISYTALEDVSPLLSDNFSAKFEPIASTGNMYQYQCTRVAVCRAVISVPP